MSLLLLTVVAAACGAAAVAVAGRRVAAVPVDSDTTAEARYLAALAASPDLVGSDRVAVPSDVFVLDEHVEFHRRVLAGDVPDRAAFPVGIGAAADADTHAQDRAELRTAAGGNADNCLALHCVVESYRQRVLAGPVDTVVANPTSDPVERFRRPLIRTVWTPGLAVRAGGAAVVALLALVVARQASPLVAVVMLPFITGAVVLAVVDWATLWLDTRFAAIWTAGTVVTVVGLWVTGTPVHPPAIVAVGVVIVVLEAGGALLRRVRGVEGHGLGDTMAIPALLGVPLALASAGTGWQGLVLAAALTVIGFAVAHIGLAVVASRMAGVPVMGTPVPAIPAWTIGPLLAWPAVTAALHALNL